jgi:hypothetical protein
MELLHGEITRGIIKSFYDVYNELGYGFLEKVYQNALYFELKERGFDCKCQEKINVYYFDKKVGEYYADILVNDKVILELKAMESLHPNHEKQLINYLKATTFEVGLLLNFGIKPEHKRKVLQNVNK